MEHLGACVQEIEMTGSGAQEAEPALGHGRQELLERLRAGQRLAELREVLELVHALAHLLVEAGVLDRPGDERGARREDLDLGVGELPRRLRVERDRANDVAVLADDRDGEERLEALLLELGDEPVARVGDGVLGESRFLALDRPPGKTLAALEGDLADELRVGLRRGAEHEPLAFVLDEVDEARVHGAGVREQPHDRAENLLQVERGPDRGDDLVEDPALAGVCRTRGYGRIVRRNLPKGGKGYHLRPDLPGPDPKPASDAAREDLASGRPA